jgi:hypothetical protein
VVRRARDLPAPTAPAKVIAAPDGPPEAAPAGAQLPALDPAAAAGPAVEAAPATTTAPEPARGPRQDPGPGLAADLGEVLDDVRLGELRRVKHIDDKLEEVEAAIKDPRQAKLRSILRELAEDARRSCDQVQTGAQFNDCDDKVVDLYETYRKNL